MGTFSINISWYRLVAVTGLVACLWACTGSKASEAGQSSGVTVQAVLPSPGDVMNIKYTFQPVSCEDGSKKGSPIKKIRPLEDQSIPGNIKSLQNTPLDKNSAHTTADIFQVTSAGCYDILVEPLAKDGSASQDCAPSTKKCVEVAKGQTKEVVLLNQCMGTDPGAGDAIAALNHPPVLEDVSFTDSKLACGSPTEVCAEASDAELDPMEMVLTARDCEVTPVASDDPGKQCWEINCHEFGKTDLTVLIYDKIWDGDVQVRIEDWLTKEGYPSKSHAQLNFYAYFDGIKMWPDADGDGYGDATAPAQILCDGDDMTGYSDVNTDCNDADATIHPGAPECGEGGAGDGKDNDCDGETDEDCTVPTPGRDSVVCNDINVFDDTGMGNANNPVMTKHLIDFTTDGPRNSAKVVWMDRGHGSKCYSGNFCTDSQLTKMRQIIVNAGYTIQNIFSTSGSITSIPAEVKIVFLWNPLIAYTLTEINAFKQFAAEGGRVVFIGEHVLYYGSAGISLENTFLINMGAVMTNIGMAVDCGYHDLPAASLRTHQITTGMNGVRIACASIIVPGPDDYAFMFDSTNTHVLAGVAKIDIKPLTTFKRAASSIKCDVQQKLDNSTPAGSEI